MPQTWSKPLCFIEGQGGQLVVNEDTVQKLSQVQNPLVIVGIVGPYRCGKSFLLNLLAGQTTGFPLGSTINACTKGIWIWLVSHPYRSDCSLLLMDTEGLGDTAKGDRNHDMWIFALNVLLSSMMVFNSRGVIDNDALEKLQYVGNVAKHIKTKTDKPSDASDYLGCFPDFLWAVRDVTLTLCDRDGKAISSDMYLEMALEEKDDMTMECSQYNHIRKCIRRFFPSRGCFTFPFPLLGTDQIAALENMREDQLAEGFMNEAKRFREYIYQKARPKQIGTQYIYGSALGILAGEYVKAIKDDKVPCIQNAVDAAAEIGNNRAIENSLKLYLTRMRDMVILPTDSIETLSSIHRKCEKEVISAYLSAAIFDSEHTYLAKLREKLEEQFYKMRRDNEQASLSRCKDILNEVGSGLNKKMISGAYVVPGGYGAYKADLEVVEQRFRATPSKGIKAEECWDQYITTKQTESSVILAADKRITEEGKLREEERQRAAAAEREQLLAVKALEKQRQELSDKNNSYKEHLQQIQHTFEKEQRRREKELASLVKAREELLKDNFDRKADLMQQRIHQLEKEQGDSDRAKQAESERMELRIRQLEREQTDANKSPDLGAMASLIGGIANLGAALITQLPDATAE